MVIYKYKWAEVNAGYARIYSSYHYMIKLCNAKISKYAFVLAFYSGERQDKAINLPRDFVA